MGEEHVGERVVAGSGRGIHKTSTTTTTTDTHTTTTATSRGTSGPGPAVKVKSCVEIERGLVFERGTRNVFVLKR